MAEYRWTGQGLAAGTTLTAGNVNTAGNGDAISTASAGTRTSLMTADGVDITGIAGGIFRLQCPFTTGLYKVTQVFFTPKEFNLGGINAFRVGAGGNTGQATSIAQDNLGKLQSWNAASAVIAASLTPALVVGHEYRIDQCIVIGTTITNGRLIQLVTDLTSSAWNTTGEFYYDSGYTINTGTVDVSMTYTGKASGFANPSGMHIRQVGWADLTTVNVSLTPSIARANFITPPTFLVCGTGTGTAPAPVVTASGSSVAAVRATGTGLAPAPVVVGSGGITYITDTFTGTDGAAWNAGNWAQAAASAGASATLLTNQGRLNTGTVTAYGGVMSMRYTGTSADTEFVGQFTFPNWLTADGSLSIRCRTNTSLSSADTYALVIVPSGGVRSAQVEKHVASVATVLGSPWSPTLTQGSIWWYRFRVVGTSIQARIWQGAEPGTWNVDVTDSAITGAGSFGLVGSGGSAAGCVIDHDNITITNGAGGTGSPTVFAGAATATGTVPAPVVLGSVPGSILDTAATAGGIPFPAAMVLGTYQVSGGGPALGTGAGIAPTVSGALPDAYSDVYSDAYVPSINAGTVIGVAAAGTATGIPPTATGGPISVTVVCATGSGTARAPVVTGTVSGTVAAVSATSSGIAPSPTLPLAPTIMAVRATGAGSITAPTVVGTQSPSVISVPAVGTGVAGTPSTGSGASASVIRAQSTGVPGVPVITGAASISSVVATGSGIAPSPTVGGNAAITATAAFASGYATASVITGSQNISVTGTVATGSGTVRTPSATGLASGSVLATRGQGAGTGVAPTATGGINISTTAVRATGTAMAVAPIVGGGTVLTLPVVVGSGTVTGWFAAGFNATPDVDGLANLVPDVGTVTFTPVHSPLLYPTASPSPLVLYPKPVVCPIGIGADAGYLLGTDGARGVHLIATDWTVSFQLTGEATPNVKITVTNGSTTDLSTLIAP